MSDQKDSRPQSDTSTNNSSKKPEKTSDREALLTPEDLDKVSGGINPQPLPPMRRDAQ